MPKPTTVTAWATNPGTTTDPGDARRETGFLPGRKLPAKWLNWLFAVNGSWFSYLRDLHIEPDFLNKHYPWTGRQEFLGRTELKGQVDSTSTDVRFAGLRTTNSLGLAGATPEVLYTDDFGNPYGRTRLKMLSLAHGIQVQTNAAAEIDNLDTYQPTVIYRGSYWHWRNTGYLHFPLDLPRGATLAYIRLGLRNTAAVERTVSAAMVTLLANKTSPSATTGAATMGMNEQVIAAGTDFVGLMVPHTGFLSTFEIQNDALTHTLQVNGNGGVRLHWIEMAYGDPGPRNG